MTLLIRGLVLPNQPPPVDTTPPSNPTSLGVSLISNVPVLTWTASTDNVKVTGYEAWRKLGSGGTYGLLAPTPALTLSDSTAVAGNTYFYTVRAFDGAGNLSGFSNEVSQSISTSDVTAPTTPPQPTLITSDNTRTPPTFQISWVSSTDPDPGLGAPVSGVQNYDVRVNVVIDPTPVPDAGTGTIGAFSSAVIGTNAGGSLVTGSDTGSVISSTSSTGDQNAVHWSSSDEYFSNGAIVSGPGWAAQHVTGETVVGGFSKSGEELRKDRSDSAQYIAFVDFGTANGLTTEMRGAAGGQAQAVGTGHAHPGYPYWRRIRWDVNWNVITDFSTDSTDPTPITGNGTFTTLATQAMSFGTQAYLNKYIATNTGGVPSPVGGTRTTNYDQFLSSGQSPNIYNGVGVIGSNTVDVRARDNATNTSAFGTAKTFTISAPVVASNRPNPWYGSYMIGSSAIDTAAWQYWASLRSLNVVNWEPSTSGASPDSYRTQTLKQVCSNVKGYSPAIVGGSKLIAYIDGTFVAFAGPKMVAAMNASKWFLYNSYTASPPVKFLNGSAPCGNWVPGGILDSAGRDYSRYLAAYWLDQYINGGVAGLADGAVVANNLLDGIYLDDGPPAASYGIADYERIGASTGGLNDYNYPSGQIAEDVQTGGNNMLAAVVSNAPRALLVGTNGGGAPSDITRIVPSVFLNSRDCPLAENMLGQSQAFGNPGLAGGGFSRMLSQYQRVASTAKSTVSSYVLYSCRVNADGSDVAGAVGNANAVSAAHIGARYQFGCCVVLGNGGWTYSNSAYDPAVIFSFDWQFINIATGAVYAFSSAASGSNWLGAAIDPPQTAAWSGSIWRRRYTNGTIYLAPQGVGSGSISITAGHLPSGSTDPLYNGAAISTWNYGDRDSIIVLT